MGEGNVLRFDTIGPPLTAIRLVKAEEQGVFKPRKVSRLDAIELIGLAEQWTGELEFVIQCSEGWDKHNPGGKLPDGEPQKELTMFREYEKLSLRVQLENMVPLLVWST